MLFGGDGTHYSARKTSRDNEKEKQSSSLKKISANQNQAQPNLNQKRQKSFDLWHNGVDTPLADTVNQKFIFYTFSLQ